MIHKLRVLLWGIVAELEYLLYPWKSSTPPQWFINRYNLDNGIRYDEDEYEQDMYYEWLRFQDQKIQKIEENIIFLVKEMDKLKRNKQ